MKTRSRMGRLLARGLPFALLTLLAACNTMHGLGRDISSAGNWIADAAGSGPAAPQQQASPQPR
jgi:predicted small secreted protein